MFRDNDLLLLVCWNINEFLFYKWDRFKPNFLLEHKKFTNWIDSVGQINVENI